MREEAAEGEGEEGAEEAEAAMVVVWSSGLRGSAGAPCRANVAASIFWENLTSPAQCTRHVYPHRGISPLGMHNFEHCYPPYRPRSTT